MYLSYPVVHQDPSGILLAIICPVSEQIVVTSRRLLSLWLVTLNAKWTPFESELE